MDARYFNNSRDAKVIPPFVRITARPPGVRARPAGRYYLGNHHRQSAHPRRLWWRGVSGLRDRPRPRRPLDKIFSRLHGAPGAQGRRLPRP